MVLVEMDMIQTIAFAVILLIIGETIVNRSKFLKEYCIPAPVVGGLIFAIIALILRNTGVLEFDMDTTLQSVAMTMFFTSVGFSASFTLLKQGGKKVFMFLGCCIGLVVLQNVVGISIASLIGLDAGFGMTTGSIPMTGGHGTAASLGKLLEDSGVTAGLSISIAAATFGLVAGGMMGGPLGRQLIDKNNLSSDDAVSLDENNSVAQDDGEENILVEGRFYSAVFLIFIAMGLGTIVSMILQKTGMTFPAYIGAMLVGAAMRNISDYKGYYEVHMKEIDIVGGISLSLFLSMALMTLRLWELADLAGEMLIMLVGQVLLMYLYARFITFNVMGRDYDAAILSAGHVGFGMGATPNGIANMNAVTERYGPSPTSFFILPLIGSLFIDFFNAGIVTAFIGFLGL